MDPDETQQWLTYRLRERHILDHYLAAQAARERAIERRRSVVLYAWLGALVAAVMLARWLLPGGQ